MNCRTKRRSVSQIILNAVIILLLALGIYPLCLALFGAFKSPNQYTLNKWVVTFPLRLENFGKAFDMIKDYMWQTVLVSVLTTVSMLAVSTMSAYAIAKLKFVGRNFLFGLILAVNMVPGVLTLVPTTMLYHTLGLYDNLLALILPGTFSTFTAFLLINYFRGIPASVFEAAEIDGAGDLQKYIFIAVPLALPMIATLAIMQVSGTWNDFGWPMLIMTRDNYTIAAGLKVGFYDFTDMPITFAAYLLSSVPLILLFFFTNKVYVEGMISSGIKL